jgi:hypothetical protein
MVGHTFGDPCNDCLLDVPFAFRTRGKDNCGLGKYIYHSKKFMSLTICFGDLRGLCRVIDANYCHVADVRMLKQQILQIYGCQLTVHIDISIEMMHLQEVPI